MQFRLLAIKKIDIHGQIGVSRGNRKKRRKNGRRRRGSGDLYLIENCPGSFRIDLKIFSFYITNPLLARLLAGHSVGSFATRSLRRSKTAKRDEAREEAGPRPRTILLSLSPRKRRLRHGAVPCVTRILAKGSPRRTGDENVSAQLFRRRYTFALYRTHCTTRELNHHRSPSPPLLPARNKSYRADIFRKLDFLSLSFSLFFFVTTTK